MKTRREAREWALKALYAYELSGNSIQLVLEQILPVAESERHLHFLQELVQETISRRDWIDSSIKEYVEKWELDRIAVIDRMILRLAICEIFFFPDIPPKVTINEAIEIAKKYSTEKSGKFVNGVLDAILHRKLMPDSGREPDSVAIEKDA